MNNDSGKDLAGNHRDISLNTVPEFSWRSRGKERKPQESLVPWETLETGTSQVQEMRRITNFRSTTDRIYDGSPIGL